MPSDQALETVTGMMLRLDDYLSKHMVQYSQVRRPSMATVVPVTTRVQPYSTFDIKFRHIDTLATPTRAISSRGRLMLSADLATAKFSHKFYVWGLDNPNYSEVVTVTLAAAQQDTFHPGWQDFYIHVKS